MIKNDFLSKKMPEKLKLIFVVLNSVGMSDHQFIKYHRQNTAKTSAEEQNIHNCHMPRIAEYSNSNNIEPAISQTMLASSSNVLFFTFILFSSPI